MNSTTDAAWTPRAFGLPSPKRPEPMHADVVAGCLEHAARHLRGLAKPDGHWCAELEGDTILESEYVLLQVILGRIGHPRIQKCARRILAMQAPGGGWSNYPAGPPDVSVTVKAYFALKLAGHSPEAPYMKMARAVIRDLGGAEAVNSFTRFYLAALGQIPYSHCPSVPPELVLLPKWFPINLYTMSAWTRAMVVPLSIFHAFKPITQLPKELGIRELYHAPPMAGHLPAVSQFVGRLISWPNFFRLADRAIKLYDRMAPARWRRPALRAAERWMLDRFAGSDGLGAIFPPMVYTILALRCLGYAEDSAEMRWAEKQLDDLIIEEDDAIRVQPCVSPVWDTAWAMVALADGGVAGDDPALIRAADWLLEREIREPGDWVVMNPQLEPSGWAFEYNNRHYADLDDTALVVLALKRTARFREDRCQAAIHRAVCFLLGMQGTDGGWAAFDKDIDNKVLEAIPFADHNAMLDPSCPDITARVLEMLGELGYRQGKPYVDSAVRFLLDHQEPEGCWFGRWGVNYIYGTWQTLVGLRAIGYDMRHPRVRRAVEWLVGVQGESGGWGESCDSYVEREQMGKGPVTPSQTAWAVLALIAAGEVNSSAVERGIQFLAKNQKSDGSWEEAPFTGTGFPKVFYLRYHYYALYFPLRALAKYQEEAATRTAGATHSMVKRSA